MALIEGEGIFGMDQGCEFHGDDRMRECSLCGMEFCAICHTGTAICPDCASAAEVNGLEDDPDLTAGETDDLRDYEDVMPGPFPDRETSGDGPRTDEEDRA